MITSFLLHTRMPFDAAARRAWLVRGSNVDGVDLVPEWLVPALAAALWRPAASSSATRSTSADPAELLAWVDVLADGMCAVMP